MHANAIISLGGMMNNNPEDINEKKTNPIQFTDEDELLDIRYDPIFKAVFTKDTPASKGALSGLISDLINKKVIVQAILTNEPPIESIFDRCIRFDIACKVETGELINIEMSYFPNFYEPMRLEYYVSRQFSRQNIKTISKDYPDLLETYQISIIGTDIFFKDNTLVHTFQYYDSVNGVSLGGKTRIITVELVKTEKIVNKPVDKMEPGEMWSVFFQYLTNREKRAKINDIIKLKEEIAMAGETLIHITRDEIEEARLTTLLKNELDYQSGMVNARRKGISEGLQKGHDETIIAVAKNALAKGYSPDNIHEITGLDLETIISLR